jgi:hypothetical protein
MTDTAQGGPTLRGTRPTINFERAEMSCLHHGQHQTPSLREGRKKQEVGKRPGRSQGDWESTQQCGLSR